MKSRSIRYVGKQRVEIVDENVSDPAAGEVLVQVLACGVCAWDLHIYRTGADGEIFHGHEGVGLVVKIGKGISGLNEGDWVCGGAMGFREFQIMPAAQLHKIPKRDRAAKHWIVEPVACIVNGLDQCQLRPGDRIAIVGCGFMGLMFVQSLAHSLVDHLIAIDVNPKRLELARQFGATDALVASEVDIAKLQELRIDTVIDCSGNQKGLELSSKIARRGGRLLLFGWNHGSASFPGDLWHMNGLTIVNATPGAALRDPWPIAIRLLDRGYIDLAPLVTHAVKLDEYPALLDRVMRGDESYIKGVVELPQR